MVPNSWKIDLQSCLGALWAPSWRQVGPRATPRPKINEKSWILRWPVGSKMEPKSIKNLIKNRLDFCKDFGTTFSWCWVDFGSKKLFKMRGLRVTFSTWLRICEKCDFEQPSNGFAIFFDFGSNDFLPQRLYFSIVFSKALWRHTFCDFGSIFAPTWKPNRIQNPLKTPLKFMLNFWWFFNGFLVALGGRDPWEKLREGGGGDPPKDYRFGDWRLDLQTWISRPPTSNLDLRLETPELEG